MLIQKPGTSINQSYYVAECNLGKVKLKPVLSAAVRGGHAPGFPFIGFVAGAFGLRFSYVFVRCFPALLAIAECLFCSHLPTLPFLHCVTLVSIMRILCGLVNIPPIYQCHGARWYSLSGLPWIPARLACITQGSTLTKAPSPSSSIGHEFNAY